MQEIMEELRLTESYRDELLKVATQLYAGMFYRDEHCYTHVALEEAKCLIEMVNEEVG